MFQMWALKLRFLRQHSWWYSVVGELDLTGSLGHCGEIDLATNHCCRQYWRNLSGHESQFRTWQNLSGHKSQFRTTLQNLSGHELLFRTTWRDLSCHESLFWITWRNLLGHESLFWTMWPNLYCYEILFWKLLQNLSCHERQFGKRKMSCHETPHWTLWRNLTCPEILLFFETPTLGPKAFLGYHFYSLAVRIYALWSLTWESDVEHLVHTTTYMYSA